MVVVSAVFPFEQVDLERKPGRVDQQPDLDLRVDPVFLAHPDLAQRVRAGVLVGDLVVQRGAVVHDQRGEPAGGGRERRARLGDLVPVIVTLTAFQRPPHGPQARARGTELGQHPQGVGLAGRLDDPGQHHRPERLISQNIEPHPRIRGGQHPPQHQRGGRHDASAGIDRSGPPTPRHWGRLVVQPGLPGRRARLARPVRDVVQARRNDGQLSQVQHVLPRRKPVVGRRQQQRQISVRARRAQMLDPLDHSSPTRDDLNRDRPGCGADLAHEPRDHRCRLPRRILSDHFNAFPAEKTQVTAPPSEHDLEGGTSQDGRRVEHPQGPAHRTARRPAPRKDPGCHVRDDR